jgi:predicted MFS family arabinose efflux permease
VSPVGQTLSLEPAAAHPRTHAYRIYVLGVLTTTCVLSYLDRNILGILLPHIKAEFELEDWQLGLLSGPVFSLIFTALTIPIAVVADRTNRRNVIAICTFFFSVMTLLCGYAAHFWQLLVGRFGVGIGEAGTLPATNSMIADLYPPEKRTSALAVYSSGTNIGLLIGFFAGGLIADAYGWRSAFLMASAPGLLIVALMFVTIAEPAKRSQALEPVRPSFVGSLRHLLRLKAYRWMIAGAAISSFSLAGSLAFVSLFLVQSHGLTTSQVGPIIAGISGVLGGLATYLSGFIADRLGRRSLGAIVLVPAIGLAAAAPLIPIFYLAENLTTALLAGVVPLMVSVTFAPPCFSLSQSLAPPLMRAQSAALMITCTYLFGTSLGPLTIGAASDLLAPHYGMGSLPRALCLTAAANIFAALCFWRVFLLLRTTSLAEDPVPLA